MSVFVKRSGLALVLAALCLGRTAGAQTADVTYSSWPIGFYSNLTVGQNSNIYGSFAGFDGSGARGGFSYMRTAFPNGWFVGGGTGGMGFGINGINQASAFGSSLYTEGAQVGYKFQNAPLTVYAGFDTLKYNTGIGSPFAPFDSTSGTLPGYRAHAGVEFQAAPNLSLSLGVGYTQQPARSDIDSLVLPGAAPFGRR
jgi:hypothetical protein